MGLTIVHEAEFDEETKMFGAKSAELTQEGVDILTEFEKENELFDDDDSEDAPEILKQLRGRVNKLEQQSMNGGSSSVDIDREVRSLRNDIERVERKIDGIQEDPWGAVDTEAVSHMKETIKRNEAMFHIFQSIFGIDVDRRVEDGEYEYGSASAIEAERVDVFDRLSTAGYTDEHERNIQNPNQVQGQAQSQTQDGGQATSDSVGGREDTSQTVSMEEEASDGNDDRTEIESEAVDESGGDGISIPEHEPPSFMESDEGEE